MNKETTTRGLRVRSQVKAGVDYGQLGSHRQIAVRPLNLDRCMSVMDRTILR